MWDIMLKTLFSMLYVRFTWKAKTVESILIIIQWVNVVAIIYAFLIFFIKLLILL